MCSPVSLQFITARELLPTKHPGADKGSLSRVPAQVSSQVRRLPIYLPAAAYMAHVLFLLAHVRSPTTYN